MATRKMLVDAIHPEETRVVVTSGSKLDEFDFESAARRQLRGNIYLAKVTRVEPSLQAAFVDYGGNRHGFLAFSEIHPDYYQIPQADRDALLEEEEENEVEQASHDTDLSGASQPSILDIDEQTAAEGETEAGAEAPESNDAKDSADVSSDDGETTQAVAVEAETVASEPVEEAPVAKTDDEAKTTPAENDGEEVAEVGSEDAMEEVPQRPRRKKAKSYKIQEVIKRRQVLLVQVVKEERGNKGAALTTYLSLAGRYSVLMPNTARGGGISRKITNAADRKRLKEVANELDVQKGMGVILRTAGASRTKAEVKRDFEYLLRLWENVRSLTLESSAPCLVYEEGSLIKRSIRDLYNKEIGEVLVSGEDAYREAKDFMRMIMPSHAKNVQPYREPQPIFSRHGVEEQLDSMFSPTVNLPSGGYLVINPTEALVSVDVNSGKSTKEHNIEDTAVTTNLEAAAELARQLRLRDMAGLVVVDFIDMEEKRNIRAVERKMKDSLKSDRARIQVGRISHFGLLEMSRQRIRFGVLESSTIACPTCSGTGLVRSVDSLALMVMRAIEDHVMRKQGQSINVKLPTDVALYLLNAKRNQLLTLEARYKLAISITSDSHMLGDQFTIEKGDPYDTGEPRQTNHIKIDTNPVAAPIVEEDEAEAEPEQEKDEERSSSRRRNKRRRGGRGRGDRDNQQQSSDTQQTSEEPAGENPANDTEERDDDKDSDANKKRRRRGRRGGRRNRRNPDEVAAAEGTADGENAEAKSEKPAMDSEAAAAIEATSTSAPVEAEKSGDEQADEKPKKRTRRPRRKKSDDQAEAKTDAPAEAKSEGESSSEAEPKEEKPKRRRTRKPKAQAEGAASEPAKSAPASEDKPAPKAEAAEEKKSSPRPERAEKKLPDEGIIVTSSSPAAKTEEKAPAEPEKKVKKGWWQRNILGN